MCAELDEGIHIFNLFNCQKHAALHITPSTHFQVNPEERFQFPYTKHHRLDYIDCMQECMCTSVCIFVNIRISLNTCEKALVWEWSIKRS